MNNKLNNKIQEAVEVMMNGAIYMIDAEDAFPGILDDETLRQFKKPEDLYRYVQDAAMKCARAFGTTMQENEEPGHIVNGDDGERHITTRYLFTMPVAPVKYMAIPPRFNFVLQITRVIPPHDSNKNYEHLRFNFTIQYEYYNKQGYPKFNTLETKVLLDDLRTDADVHAKAMLLALESNGKFVTRRVYPCMGKMTYILPKGAKEQAHLGTPMVLSSLLSTSVLYSHMVWINPMFISPFENTIEYCQRLLDGPFNGEKIRTMQQMQAQQGFYSPGIYNLEAQGMEVNYNTSIFGGSIDVHAGFLFQINQCIANGLCAISPNTRAWATIGHKFIMAVGVYGQLKAAEQANMGVMVNQTPQDMLTHYYNIGVSVIREKYSGTFGHFHDILSIMPNIPLAQTQEVSPK